MMSGGREAGGTGSRAAARLERVGLLALALSASAAAAAVPVGGWATGREGQVAPGAVYVMTNAPDRNEIVIYQREADGTLELAGRVATGGSGYAGSPVDPLASQNSLVLSRNQRWLVAANAGSDQISLLRVEPDGLAVTDVVDSGGTFPVSVTLRGSLVYVLNAGGNVGATDNLTGFTIGPDGKLTPLPGSTRALSAPSTRPAQIGFSPDGSSLVVTEKGTSVIDTFAVDENGLPAADPVVSRSAGRTPFGFLFDHRGLLVVSEAGPPSAVSSYVIEPDGALTVLSASVGNGQAATCWIAGNGGDRVYTANAGSSTISEYGLATDGTLALLDAVAAGAAGTTPIGDSVTPNGRFLYTLNALTGTVGMYAVEPDGGLRALGEAGGLPADAGVQGIASR